MKKYIYHIVALLIIAISITAAYRVHTTTKKLIDDKVHTELIKETIK